MDRALGVRNGGLRWLWAWGSSYPTDEQRRHGFTGGDIGIHGPKRGFRWLGSWTRLSDWTRGCIAVGTDDAIQKLVAWVREHHATRIHIL